MEISGFQALRSGLRDVPPRTAVVAAAHDPHTLEAVFQAQRDGLIRPLLVGERDKILRMAEDLGAPMPEEDVVDARDDRECANRSVELIRQGQGQLRIKGLLPTGPLLGAVVRRESGIRAAELLSHVAILDVPAYHKLMFITDGGMVVAPDLEQKRAILKNALGLCRFLGYEEPKAAVLCAVETVSPHMAETGDGAALKAEAERGDFGHCQVEGPISFDLATDRQEQSLSSEHNQLRHSP